jgi:hypothetical protein
VRDSSGGRLASRFDESKQLGDVGLRFHTSSKRNPF